jgi:hypothetical protein
MPVFVIYDKKGKKEIFDLFPEGIRGDSISPTN